MTQAEARALVDGVMRGRTLTARWEGPDSCCTLVVRREGEGLVSSWDEIPYDVQNPWPAPRTETWSEDQFVSFLQGFRSGTEEITI